MTTRRLPDATTRARLQSSLQKLDLSKNDIRETSELLHLSQLFNLRSIWLAENPATSAAFDHAPLALALLPALEIVDGRARPGPRAARPPVARAASRLLAEAVAVAAVVTSAQSWEAEASAASCRVVSSCRVRTPMTTCGSTRSACSAARRARVARCWSPVRAQLTPRPAPLGP